MDNIIISETIGTFLLVLLGDGVVANVLLKDTKGHGSGWIVITMGWAMAVFIGVSVAGPFSGAHINPAVTIGLAAADLTPWVQVPLYLAGQMLGAFLGAVAVWFFYKPHFKITDDPDTKLAVFSTTPAIRNRTSNLFAEILGTFVLVLVVLFFSTKNAPEAGLGAVGALPVALLVLVIGLSLGGTTGYAINPARDLGPRIAHALLPIPGKRDSDWSYSWIPVLGPTIGGLLAAVSFYLLF